MLAIKLIIIECLLLSNLRFFLDMHIELELGELEVVLDAWLLGVGVDEGESDGS